MRTNKLRSPNWVLSLAFLAFATCLVLGIRFGNKQRRIACALRALNAEVCYKMPNNERWNELFEKEPPIDTWERIVGVDLLYNVGAVSFCNCTPQEAQAAVELAIRLDHLEDISAWSDEIPPELLRKICQTHPNLTIWYDRGRVYCDCIPTHPEGRKRKRQN